MVLLLKKQQQPSQQLSSLLSSQLPFSQPMSQTPASASYQYPSPNSSTSSLKSNMNSQLLCTQALLESTEYKLLAYDNISQIKKTVSKLENQLSSLNSKINIELKILQASNLLQPDLNLHDDLDKFPERFKQLYDQKESVQSQLIDLRTLLVQHFSAALALGYKKLERLLTHPSSNPSHTQLSTPFSLVGSPSPSSKQPSSYSNKPTTFSKFDGPHMFASDQTGPSLFGPLRNQNSPKPFQLPSPPSLKTIQENQHLKDEIASLKALLEAKESIIAEQASDINLLELEVETLKQSSSDQASHLHEQLSSQKDSQTQIESLLSQNSKLSEALQSSNDQVDSTTNQINQLKLQVDQLNSELSRERSEHDSYQKSNHLHLQEADKLAENSRSELKLTITNLQSECEVAQQSSQKAWGQVEKLQTDLKSSQDREIQLQSEFNSLQTQSLSKDQALVAVEAEHKADWEFLINKLLNLSRKFNDDQMSSSKLGKLLSQLSSSDSQVELLKNPKDFSQKLVDGLGDYMANLNAQLATFKIGNDSSSTLTQELERLQQSIKQERTEFTAQVTELRSQNDELKKKHESLKSEQATTNADSSELESLKQEVVTVKQQLAAKDSSALADYNLRELWKLLPSNLDSRGTMNPDSDLSQLKSLYESPRKVSGGGLGGLFAGLGRRAATPTTPQEEPEFSIELMSEKIRLLIDNDKKFIERLIQYEAEKDSHKTNSLRAQKLVTESQDALRTYQSQVQELEERLEYANTQSAAMLEKVNDLMESEERSNMIARRAELNVQKLQSEIESMQIQIKLLSTSKT